MINCFFIYLGDPEGEMNVSPGGYGYLTGTLAALEIPYCVLLEGGYFIDSVAQGSLYTIKALIQKVFSFFANFIIFFYKFK